MTDDKKTCRWWESHQWGKWVIAEDHSTGTISTLVFQRRVCERCGKVDQEYVGPRP